MNNGANLITVVTKMPSLSFKSDYITEEYNRIIMIYTICMLHLVFLEWVNQGETDEAYSMQELSKCK
jgi:hypothetical protein